VVGVGPQDRDAPTCWRAGRRTTVWAIHAVVEPDVVELRCGTVPGPAKDSYDAVTLSLSELFVQSWLVAPGAGGRTVPLLVRRWTTTVPVAVVDTVEEEVAVSPEPVAPPTAAMGLLPLTPRYPTIPPTMSPVVVSGRGKLATGSLSTATFQ
jgi:hypothetical protein